MGDKKMRVLLHFSELVPTLGIGDFIKLLTERKGYEFETTRSSTTNLYVKMPPMTSDTGTSCDKKAKTIVIWTPSHNVREQSVNHMRGTFWRALESYTLTPDVVVVFVGSKYWNIFKPLVSDLEKEGGNFSKLPHLLVCMENASDAIAAIEKLLS